MPARRFTINGQMKRWTPILCVLMMLALTTTVAMACPLCKESIPSSDAQSPGALPSGFNTSIYVMLGGLFGVLGLVGFTIVRGVRSSAAHVSARRGFPVG